MGSALLLVFRYIPWLCIQVETSLKQKCGATGFETLCQECKELCCSYSCVLRSCSAEAHLCRVAGYYRCAVCYLEIAQRQSDCPTHLRAPHSPLWTTDSSSCSQRAGLILANICWTDAAAIQRTAVPHRLHACSYAYDIGHDPSLTLVSKFAASNIWGVENTRTRVVCFAWGGVGGLGS